MTTAIMTYTPVPGCPHTLVGSDDGLHSTARTKKKGIRKLKGTPSPHGIQYHVKDIDGKDVFGTIEQFKEVVAGNLALDKLRSSKPARQTTMEIPLVGEATGRGDAPKPSGSPKFWLIWNERGGSPSVKHGSKEEAEAEANRLAENHHAGIFHVTELVSTFRAKTTVERAEAEEPIPF
jgi:hypothetical protein